MDPTKPSKLIPRERLQFTEDEWLKGTPEHRLQAAIAERYGVTLRTGRNYIARVRAKLALRDRVPPEAVVARCEAMLLEAYETARSRRSKNGDENPDTSAMVAASWRIAELHGAVAPRRTELSGPNGGPIALTDARGSLAAALAAEAAEPDGGGEDEGPGEAP